VPGELQWSEDDGSLPDISFENLPDATECPFCKRQPVIKAFEWDRGCRIGPEPYILNQFQLKCCGWIAPVTFDSPISAIDPGTQNFLSNHPIQPIGLAYAGGICTSKFQEKP
jgi:hypothetical protein